MSNKGHKCEAVLVSCIDFRFHRSLVNYVRYQMQVPSFDLVCLAGSAKGLASPEHVGEKEIILRNIGISARLHKIKRVILTNHRDCGAYGGSKRFKSKKEELEFHQKELAKARVVVEEEFPNLDIETIFVYTIRDKVEFRRT